MGGSTFAVQASNTYTSNYPEYLAWDGEASTCWANKQATSTGWYSFYNPDPIKITSIQITNDNSSFSTPATGAVYGSDDGNNWIYLSDFTNSNATNGSTWTMTVNSTSFYKYHKIQINSSSNASACAFAEIHPVAYKMQTVVAPDYVNAWASNCAVKWVIKY